MCDEEDDGRLMILCSKCKKPLSESPDGEGNIIVEPCTDCLNALYHNGYDDGRIAGRAERDEAKEAAKDPDFDGYPGGSQ
jgi:hypothetical protein